MAPQCAPVMVPTPPGSTSPYSNNQAAVAGLLRQKYREMQQARAIIFEAASSSSSSAASSSSSSASPPPGCPMHAGGATAPPASSSSSSGAINPANNMPFNLSLPSSESSSASGSRVKLSKERTISSIPRAESSPAPGASPYDPPAAPPSACPVAHKPKSEPDDASAPSRWEYPSPEQFQAALARKNKAAPDKYVEMMVLVHNFMNEEAWKLVLDWEKDFGVDTDKVGLLRFTGRPGELSPRARWYGLLGSVLPSRYNATPPFDRHDWIVSRPDGTTARYVIDYYGDDEADAQDERRRLERERARAEGAKIDDDEDEGDDQARFVLDVRPALDSFAALRVRAARTFREYSYATGAEQGAQQTSSSSS